MLLVTDSLSVVIDSVVDGSVVTGSVIICSVVLGANVTDSVVICSVVAGSTVTGFVGVAVDCKGPSVVAPFKNSKTEKRTTCTSIC